MVMLSPKARDGRSTRTLLSPLLLPVVTLPWLVVTLPAIRARLDSRLSVMTRS